VFLFYACYQKNLFKLIVVLKRRVPRIWWGGVWQTMCTLQALQLLLDAGGTPECRDKVSMEGPFDVAQNDEIRTILVCMMFLFLLC
jgi:hypothetical protein